MFVPGRAPPLSGTMGAGVCQKQACKAADCKAKGIANPYDKTCRVCGGKGNLGTGLCGKQACVAADCEAKGGSGPHKRARGSSASAAAAPAASSASAPDPASASAPAAASASAVSVLAGGATTIVEDADGDCLYHALARFVTGSPDSTAQVRREIAAYIQQNSAAFAVFAEGDQSGTMPSRSPAETARCLLCHSRQGSLSRQPPPSALLPLSPSPVMVHRRKTADGRRQDSRRRTVADLAHGVATNAWGGAETLQAFAQLTEQA